MKTNKTKEEIELVEDSDNFTSDNYGSESVDKWLL